MKKLKYSYKSIHYSISLWNPYASHYMIPVHYTEPFISTLTYWWLSFFPLCWEPNIVRPCSDFLLIPPYWAWIPPWDALLLSFLSCNNQAFMLACYCDMWRNFGSEVTFSWCFLSSLIITLMPVCLIPSVWKPYYVCFGRQDSPKL